MPVFHTEGDGTGTEGDGMGTAGGGMGMQKMPSITHLSLYGTWVHWSPLGWNPPSPKKGSRHGTPKPTQEHPGFQWRGEAAGRGAVSGSRRGGGWQGIGTAGGHLLTVRVHLGQTLTRIEYWDRAGGGRNIV